MARKSILLSDPSVRDMNEAQWMFEYYALREREKNTVDLVTSMFRALVRALRHTLITVLGLDLIRSWYAAGVRGKDKLDALKEETPYIPAVYIFGDPARIDKLIGLDDGKTDEEREAEDRQIAAVNHAIRSGALEDQIPAYREPYKLTDTIEFREQYRARFGRDFPAELLKQKQAETQNQPGAVQPGVVQPVAVQPETEAATKEPKLTPPSTAGRPIGKV